MKRLLSVICCCLSAALLPGPAVADPPVPSAGAVRHAGDVAARRAAAVAALQRRFSAADSAERALDARAELAVEAYDGAVERRRRADAAARRARAAAVRAAAARERARLAAASLAAQLYRTGVPAQLAALGGLLRADDLQQAMRRRSASRVLAEHSAAVLAQSAATAARAAVTDAAARRAAAAAARAAQAVGAAERQAVRRVRQQRSELVRLAARRAVLLARLAAAQRISVALAAQRQQALAAQAAKAAAEATARAQAAREQAAQSRPPGRFPAAPAGGAAAAVAFARAQLGLPYVWGAAGPDSYDCSGLTMRAWERAGVRLPHFAADQYAVSTPLTYAQLRPGDLVFWSHDGTPAGIYHVAIYVGDDRMIEAPHTGATVKTADLWIMGVPDYYARP